MLLALPVLSVILLEFMLAPRPEDFQMFYIAGHHIVSGNCLQLYDVAAYPPGTIWIRPAWQALEFVPFALLPLKTAYVLWVVFNLGVFALCAWMKRREIALIFCDSSMFLRRFSLIALLIPVGQALRFGQDAGIFLLLFMMGLRAAQEGRDRDAGMWFSASSFNIHILFPIVILTVLRKRWEIFWTMAICGTGLFLLSTAVAGPGWVASSLAIGSKFMGYETLRYILTVIGLNNRLIVAILAFGIIGTFWAMRKAPFEKAGAWLVVSAVFFGWHAVTYNYVAALPAITDTGKDANDEATQT